MLQKWRNFAKSGHTACSTTHQKDARGPKWGMDRMAISVTRSAKESGHFEALFSQYLAKL